MSEETLRDAVVKLEDCLLAKDEEMAALKTEYTKLLKVARAAGRFLESHFWEEDDETEMGHALAKAMNEWKGPKS